MKKMFLFVTMICLIGSLVFARAAAEVPKQQENTKGSFVIKNDSTYYYSANGVMLTGDYVANGGDIWYFCEDGRGIKINYKYLARNLIQIFDYGYDSCFLLIGTEKALWIDSMFGFGNLVKLTKIFTDKPIEGVALTHNHIDHIGGMFYFDKVYLNEFDYLENFASRQARYDDNMTTMRTYPPSIGGFYPGTAWGFSIDDYAENRPVNLVSFKNGTVIDVGGASIEAIHTPGHSAGMTSILFREHRILLTGDEVNHNTLISGGLTSYRNVIQGLIDRKAEKNEWDKILISHGIMETEAPHNVLEEMLEICNGIIDGTIVGVPYQVGNRPPDPNRMRAYPVNMSQMRLDGGFTNIVYNKALIFN